MSDRKTNSSSGRTPDVYLKLVRRCPLRPIRSEEELDQAIAMINSLLDREDLDPAEQDYLDVLSDLVERYETTEHPIEDVSQADVLEHLLDARQVTPAKVAKATGISASALADVLAGKKSLGRVHIGKLARYFHVDPEIFISEVS